MTLPSPELAEKLAGYLVDRRDKRIITFGVLATYLGVTLYSLVGHSLGLAESRIVLDSTEGLAMVVVVAHIAGGVAQRGLAHHLARRAAAGAATALQPDAPRGDGPDAAEKACAP
jgi:hypothetical protein